MNSEVTFRNVLKECVDLAGKEQQFDWKRVINFLSDLGPQFEKERRTLLHLYSEGHALDKMHQDIIGRRDLKYSVVKYVGYMDEVMEIKQSHAEYIVCSIVYALTGQQIDLSESDESVGESFASGHISGKVSGQTSSQITDQTSKDSFYQNQASLKQSQNSTSSGKTASDNKTSTGKEDKVSRARTAHQTAVAKYKAKDYREAFSQFTIASSLDVFPESHYCLGIMYENGYYVNKNDAKAIELYKKAIAEGHEKSKDALKRLTEQLKRTTYSYSSNYDSKSAHYYSIGIQCFAKWNYKDCYDNMIKAADLGNADAMEYIGFMYQQGYHVKSNEKKALEWYEKAAKKGHKEAKAKLEQLRVKSAPKKTTAPTSLSNYSQNKQLSAQEFYELGGKAFSSLDYKGMYNNYKVAADMGHVEAIYYMGYMYQQGYYVDKDEGKALGWYARAAKKGHKAARTKMMQLKNKGITPIPS